MNLANKLTLMRVILVPFFVAFMLIDAIPLNYLWALLVFAIASITDMLDGKIARKYNMITSFGKFLDPLADQGYWSRRRWSVSFSSAGAARG